MYLNEYLQNQYGFSYEEATTSTSTFLKAFRSCPDNSQTTLDSWRSYLWDKSLPNQFKHLTDAIYEKWLKLRYHYLQMPLDYEKLLEQLRGQNYRLALITNGPSNAQWEKIRKLKIRNFFDCILVSSDLPWEKPNPNIFLTACRLLNVKPNECLMIGDKLETDIKGGKDAQLRGTIWIPINSDDNDLLGEIEPLPDLIVKNLVEIMQFLPKSSHSPTTTNSGNGSSSSSSNVGGGVGTSTGSGAGKFSIGGIRRLSHQTSLHQFRKPIRYRRGISLPDASAIDSNGENSSDSFYS